MSKTLRLSNRQAALLEVILATAATVQDEVIKQLSGDPEVNAEKLREARDDKAEIEEVWRRLG